MKNTDIVDNQYMRDDIPYFCPGDEVKVHVRVVESGKERVQIFQGNIISIKKPKSANRVTTNAFLLAAIAEAFVK